MHSDVITKIDRGIKRSVPLMGVATADPSEAVKSITAIVDDLAKQVGKSWGLLVWDCTQGLRALNPVGKKTLAQLLVPPAIPGDGASLSDALPQDDDDSGGPFALDPVGVLQKLGEVPERTTIIFHQAHRFLVEPMNAPDPQQTRAAIQAVVNLRDKFVAARSIIFLGQEMRLAMELQSDVQTFDDPLPGREELAAIVHERHSTKDAKTGAITQIKIDVAHVDRAVDWLTGLTAFGARQAVTLSLPGQGQPCDLKMLRLRRHTMIEQVNGLHVYPPQFTFDDVAGYEWVKSHLHRINSGKRPIKLFVHVDEIEKALEGLGTESSGVTGDQLGVILENMERYRHRGLIAYGPPGTGKTFLAETSGPTFDVDTIRLDLGAAKGMHVSESESYIRRCLQTINAMGVGEVYWIATCNSVAKLPSALKRRFTDGIVYFDLPTEAEREAVWQVHIKARGLTPKTHKTKQLPDSNLWSCADIRNCCERAWEFDIPLQEVAVGMNPGGVADPGEINNYRKHATGRLQSASTGKRYEMPKGNISGEAVVVE